MIKQQEKKKPNTSWSPVAKWYGDIVGEKGHYFHQNIILPGVKKLLDPRAGESVIDVGCGQGIYARTLSPGVEYTGIDLAKELIDAAKKMDGDHNHTYFVADATHGLPLAANSVDHAISLLALQNMRDAAATIANIGIVLKQRGDFVFVLNHPAYRIPRQSSWGEDALNKLEYRRVNRYLSPLEIPINAHPGLKDSPVTWTYHQPIEYYVRALKAAGLAVTDLQEWTSDKESVGKAGRAENRARKEFPLFLAIRAQKIV